MKRGASDHPKFKRLARLLKIERAHAVGLEECLIDWTRTYAPSGDVGRFPDEEIAEGAGWHGPVETFINAALAAKLIDHSDNCRWVLHDWSEHADDAVHMQLARARRYFADGTTPRFTRLSKEERKQIEIDFAEGRTHDTRTAYAPPSPPLPSPPIPSHPCAADAANPDSGKQAKTRPPDPLWDFVVARWFPSGVAPSQRTRIGRVRKDFLSLGASPAEIARRADNAARSWSGRTVTPESVVKHWDSLANGTSDGEIPDVTPTHEQVQELLREPAP